MCCPRAKVIELPDRFSRGHALVIGVGADLPVTVQDARAVASIFRDPQRCAYLPNQVRLLTEAQASCDGVVGALRSLAVEVTPDDTLTVYYSGHGVAAGNERYFLLTHGADHTALDETALDGRLFTELLLAVPARRLLLLLDCCRAGGIFDRTVGKAAPEMRPDIPVNMMAMLARGSGTVVVASSTADEVSLIKGGYSVFTYVLIEALCGAGAAKRDGYVYASDLALHTRERVPALTNNLQHPTMTFRKADDYPVAYYAAGGVQPKGVPQGFVLLETATTDVKTVLRLIRKLLLELPMEPREVQVMVEDMGMGGVTLHYDSGPRVYWDELLRTADLRRSMDQVFGVLDPQFGDNPEWLGLKAAYRAARTSPEQLPGAKVLPFTRQAGRPESRRPWPPTIDSEFPPTDRLAQLADGLLSQATALLSDIRALSGAASNAPLWTAATPVRLGIADMTRAIEDLAGEMADGAADFDCVNAIALIREKFDLIDALLDHRQPRRQVDRLVEAGNAIVAAANRLAHALHDQAGR